MPLVKMHTRALSRHLAARGVADKGGGGVEVDLGLGRRQLAQGGPAAVLVAGAELLGCARDARRTIMHRSCTAAATHLSRSTWPCSSNATSSAMACACGLSDAFLHPAGAVWARAAAAAGHRARGGAPQDIATRAMIALTERRGSSAGELPALERLAGGDARPVVGCAVTSRKVAT